MSMDLKKDIINAAREASEASKTLSLSPHKPNKEEAILRLVESLNIGDEEVDKKIFDLHEKNLFKKLDLPKYRPSSDVYK